MDIADKPSASAVEVWIAKKFLDLTGRVVFTDESSQDITIDSLSLRGAQREVTSWLRAQGFEPAGRWQDEDSGDDGSGDYAECSRSFRRS